MAITVGYMSMPALRSLRSSSQDYTGHMSRKDSVIQRKRASVSIPPNTKDDTGYLPRKQTPATRVTRDVVPAANRAPPEILLDIFFMLSPQDFNNARHTCSQWMRVSLNNKLLEAMLKRAGWWDAWLQDRRRPHRSDRVDESDTWRMSRRFATECLLTGRKSAAERSGFCKTSMVDFSGLSGTVKKPRGNRLQPVIRIDESKGLGTSTFNVSSCSNYLLVTTGCMIYVYRLGGRKVRSTSSDWNEADLAPVSRISCPFGVISAAIDTSKPRFTIAALLCNRVGMICELDMTQLYNSNSYTESPSKPPYAAMVDPSSYHFFYNICTEETPPRTVALCPGRSLVAFGCASGIEIYGVNKTKRNDHRKHFTLPQPSEILHFLPSSPETPSELRLISSLSGPGLHECQCPPSSPKNKFHFLADVQSFSHRRIPHTPSRSFVRATHCHHYRAVPITDGFHMMFIEPRTNLLCIGSDAPIGGPTSLARAFVCIPPFANIPPFADISPETNPPPTTFAAAADLTWGLRVAAVYGSRLVLYSIPLDIFNIVRRERERQAHGLMGEDDLARDWYADEDRPNPEWGRDVFRSAAMMWPFKVHGKEIGVVDDAVELSVQCAEGGMRVWAFGSSGKGEVFDVDTGDMSFRSFGVAGDGGPVRKNASLGLKRKRKRSFDQGGGFAGRYGSSYSDLQPCKAGVHGQEMAVRRSSFAACIIDFKIPELE